MTHVTHCGLAHVKVKTGRKKKHSYLILKTGFTKKLIPRRVV